MYAEFFMQVILSTHGIAQDYISVTVLAIQKYKKAKKNTLRHQLVQSVLISKTLYLSLFVHFISVNYVISARKPISWSKIVQPTGGTIEKCFMNGATCSVREIPKQ